MSSTSFYNAPSPGVPEGVNGIIHALSMLRSAYGVRVDPAAIATVRAAADAGMSLSLIVDLRTFRDGKIYRLRYNVPEEGSGTYVDSDGVSVHVDSEAYDFEFAVGLGFPENVRLYATSRSGARSLPFSQRNRLIFDGSNIVGRGLAYRIFLSQDDVDPQWIDAVKSRSHDFFLSLPRRRSSGSLKIRHVISPSNRERLISYGWSESRIKELEKKASEANNPSQYVSRAVQFADIDAYRRAVREARMRELEKELARQKIEERELFTKLLDEANKIVRSLGPSDSINAEMAVNRKFFGYSDDDFVSLGYPGISKNSREQRISRGARAMISAGASAPLAALLRRRSTVSEEGIKEDAAGAWNSFYSDYVLTNKNSSGAVEPSSVLLFGAAVLAGAAAMKIASR
jgi:hypothetical protein